MINRFVPLTPISMRHMLRYAVLIMTVVVPLSTFGQDLYIKDTPADTGVEPNPNPGAMYVTEDIWVRITPDPAYQPFAFAEASPPWTPAPHQGAEYRDPKYGVPNWIYVRVRNRGGAASTGTERLLVYWAKASTGLSWPTQWVDYMASNCGPSKLYGMEVTKPRKNAATATAAERDAYRDAILSVGTLPAFDFSDGISYWHKQDEVHEFGPSNRHGTVAFPPWHREFINRYEALLQEANPLVKLLYWDWTTDPENSSGFNFFSPTFMGASGRGAGNSGVSMGAPFLPALDPPAVIRRLQPNPPQASSNGSVLAPALYPNFSSNIESPSHDNSHVFIGGFVPPSGPGIGDMSFIPRAAEDPFFFLLHGNVDRLWAQWQRNTASIARLDPATTYGLSSGNVNITTNMAPWDGTGSPIVPYTVAGGYIVARNALHPAIVSPPIYDSAPLVIPPLAPGQAVVLQIPWFPPNPADFACFGDQQHFCILARIETSITAPFGMTTPETVNVNSNTRANNNIVWKNISVVDNFAGGLLLASILVRNPFREAVQMGLRFSPTRETGDRFFRTGRIFMDLKGELFKRWLEGNSVGRGIKPVDRERGRIEITGPEAFLQNIRVAPEETFGVDLMFELAKDYRPEPGFVPKFDLVQTGTPRRRDEIVGGQRFEVDVQRLALVPAGSEWRYLDTGAKPGRGWLEPDFDDTKWKIGRAEFGYADDPVTTIDGGPRGRRRITSYYRRSFDVADRSFIRDLLLHLKRDDGAVVYLNGREIHRVNVSADAGPNVPASQTVDGVAEETFFPSDVPVNLLRNGRNVIAVELHQDSPRTADASFDLALTANHASRNVAPAVMFLSPPYGSLWQVGETVPILIDGIDPDGKVRAVQFSIDGKQVATADQPLFKFQWPATGIGTHRLRAVVVGSDELRATAETTISVVENVPPVVRLTAPAEGASLRRREPLVALAEASDRGGSVARVEFWIREADFFGSRPQLAGTAERPPFVATLRDIPPGQHFMITAVAVDDRGERSPSFPVHVSINGDEEHHEP